MIRRQEMAKTLLKQKVVERCHKLISSNVKFPIVNNFKECGCCHGVLPISDFSKTSLRKKSSQFVKVGYRTNCKKCRSRYSSRHELEKKIIRYPNRYIDCKNEDCNWIYSKRLKNCPRCKK